VQGQQVIVSSEISLRNDVAYELLGRIEDEIILYQDKGNEKKILLFDKFLEFQSERFLKLEDKRPVVYEVVNMDTAFCLLYGYRLEDELLIRMNVFSKTAELLDSLTVYSQDRTWNGLNYETVLSEDRAKIAFYDIINNEQVRLLVYDLHDRELLTNKEVLIKNGGLVDDFRQVLLTNDGDFFLLTEVNNNKTTRSSHVAKVFRFMIGESGVSEIAVPLEDLVCADLMISYDNVNDNLGIAGLYDEKKTNHSKGYFWLSSSPESFDNVEINLIPFSELVFFEVYGDRKKKALENFVVSDIIWKRNGSPLLIFEMASDLSRRTGANNYYYSNGLGSYGSISGWSDHYREDLVIISLLPSGEEHWHRVFYKKQFSQNDGAIYSSFYPFLTPSRLRIIYNDEIKSNSTVSEYVIDGTGNYKRTSVLSTEYQNLRLRFPDAVQLSSAELLVPSQKSYTLNLVKIDYSK
jgi:hypothetical protein